MNHESAFQSEMRAKQQELKTNIRALRSVSVEIGDQLRDDRDRVNTLAKGYNKSTGLLSNTFKALDGLLEESEVRLAIYVGGVLFLMFLLLWKLT